MPASGVGQHARMTTGIAHQKMHRSGSTPHKRGKLSQNRSGKNENSLHFWVGQHPGMVGQHKTE